MSNENDTQTEAVATRTMHALKTWPDFFQAIADGRKNFEVRYDDRGFQAGDMVVLREWDPNHHASGLSIADTQYTGRSITATIGYVLHQPVGGVGATLNGYVVFSLLDINRESA